MVPALMIAAGIPAVGDAGTTTESPESSGGTTIKVALWAAATITTIAGFTMVWGGVDSEGAPDEESSPMGRFGATTFARAAIPPRQVDLIRDDVHRPEVVECLRSAFDEQRRERQVELPGYDGHYRNIVGAIFGGEPPVKRGGDLPPEGYPLAVPAAPTRGDDDAAAELVVCGDYDSALTRSVADTIDQLQTHYGGDLRLRWLQAPVTTGRRSLRARAAVAAREQGAFWAMHPRLMSAEPIEDEAHMQHLAAQAGLDAPRFAAHLSAESTFAQINYEHDVCTAHGGLVEPRFFVRDASVAGAVPFDRLATLIDEAVARSSSTR